MDWMKSKSILIIALILTNGILLYNVWGNRDFFRDVTDRDGSSWQQVEAIARSKQVTLDQKFVFPSEKLQGMRLEYQMYDPEQVAQNLLGLYTEELGKYRNDLGDEMTLENGNKLLYAKNILKENETSDLLTIDSAKLKAEDFIDDIHFQSADMSYWNVEQTGNQTVVVYRQYYKNYFLDDAYIRVIFTGSQISGFERKWFNPPEMLEDSRAIIEPSKAFFLVLDALSEEKEPLPVTIEKMELGYRLDSDALVSSVKSGEASPYWRFLTSSGHIYYIEAQQ